jgi:hypothetical protein
MKRLRDVLSAATALLQVVLLLGRPTHGRSGGSSLPRHDGGRAHLAVQAACMNTDRMQTMAHLRVNIMSAPGLGLVSRADARRHFLLRGSRALRSMQPQFSQALRQSRISSRIPSTPFPTPSALRSSPDPS